jgi:hypothetical protein
MAKEHPNPITPQNSSLTDSKAKSPPSTTQSLPVTKLAFPLAKNTTTSATSSTLAVRSMGTACSIIPCRIGFAFKAAFNIGVFTHEGLTLTTLMLWGALSRAVEGGS